MSVVLPLWADFLTGRIDFGKIDDCHKLVEYDILNKT
jgi:hypothetical protein